jgi:hypothetical protein
MKHGWPSPSTAKIVPVTSTQLRAVMAAPVFGLSPTSPLITEVGTFVTPVPARIAKLAVVPSGTGACAATALVAKASGIRDPRASRPTAPRFLKSLMCGSFLG